MHGLETIESAFARRKCALVSLPEFGGTGISGVIAEFLQGEMNAKKREQPVGHQNWLAQTLDLALFKQNRDFAAVRSNRAAIACHRGVCAPSVQGDAFH